MSVPFIFSCDPARMAHLSAGDDPHLTALIEGVEPEREHHVDNRYRDIIVPLLDQLPPREADCIEMYFGRRMTECNIAAFFGITQAAVCYRIKRAAQRLKFLVEIPKISDSEAEALLSTTGLSVIDIQVLLDYRTTSRQTQTAERLGRTQGNVRYRIRRSCAHLEVLAATRPELRDVAKMFCMYRDHPNILQRVELPQWQGRDTMERDDRFA